MKRLKGNHHLALCLLVITICIPFFSAMPVRAAYLGNNSGTIETVAEGDTVNNNEGVIVTNHGEISANMNIIKTNYGTITSNWTNARVETNRGSIGTNLGSVTSNYGEIQTNTNGSICNLKGGVIESNNGKVLPNYGTVKHNYSQGVIKGEVMLFDGGAVITNDGSVSTLKSSDVTCAVEENNKAFSVDAATAFVTNNSGKIDVNMAGNITVEQNSGEIRLWNSVGGVNGYAGGTGFINNNTGTITVANGATAYIVENTGTISEYSGDDVSVYRPYEIVNMTDASIKPDDGVASEHGYNWIKNGASFSVSGGDASYEVSADGAMVFMEGDKIYVSNISDKVIIHIEPHNEHRYGDWITIRESTCEDSGEKIRKCSHCGDEESATIDPSGHNWSDPIYTWTADNKHVTASRVCKNNQNHKETETVSTTSRITSPPTYDHRGQTTYTAVFNNSSFSTQTKRVDDIDPLKRTYQKGLNKINGVWIYCDQDGQKIVFTGVVKRPSDNKWFYVKNGIYHRYTGLAKSIANKKLYYVSKGSLDWKYTGLVKYGKKYYAVKRGAVQYKFTGVVQNKSNKKWYFCKNGVYTKNYTGLAKSITNGKLYYVKKGQLNWKYSGKVKYGKNKYKVVKGVAKGVVK